MRFRKLRIAWSLTCGVACALLVALWMRSCFRYDMVYHRPTIYAMYVFRSYEGEISYGNWFLRANTMGAPPKIGWEIRTGPIGGSDVPDASPFHKVFRWFQLTDGVGYPGCMVPYWFLVLVSAALVYVPWLPWSNRFGLRTLLVATTLVAVILGAVVYAVR